MNDRNAILENSLAYDLREAMSADARSLYQLARDAGVAYQVLYRFRSGQRANLRLDTAGRLCCTLGLRLQTAKK